MNRPPGGRFGVILAAGQGSRFRGLKQFARLRGRPLVYFSVMAFEHSPAITGYVLVVNRSKTSVVRRWTTTWHLSRLIAVVPGGRLRPDSVTNGLSALPSHGWVAIHDAVRPFITPAMLARGFAVCRRNRAATFGIQVTDTLKRARAGRIKSTVDRRNLVAIQTPQFFELQLIRSAHIRRRRFEATDDCVLVERLGVRPVLIPGTSRNIKVTTRSDMDLCKALM